MDLALTEEQSLLKDTVTRFLQERSPFETLAEARTREVGWRPEIWTELAELGLLGLPFAEDDGGFGYLEDNYNLTRFVWNDAKKTLGISSEKGAASPRSFRIELATGGEAKTIDWQGDNAEITF